MDENGDEGGARAGPPCNEGVLLRLERWREAGLAWLQYMIARSLLLTLLW